METYSYHAWLQYGIKVLFTEEFTDLGPLLPGGMFQGGKIPPRDWKGKSPIEDIIHETAKQKLREKLEKSLRPDYIGKMYLKREKPDQIDIGGDKKINITKMYIWEVSMYPKSFKRIEERARIPVRLLDYFEIMEMVRSTATKELAKDILGSAI
jgi:hypothetical protein